MSRDRLLFIIALLMTLLIGFFDIETGSLISLMLLYAVPILATAWYCGKMEGIITPVLNARMAGN